MKKLVAVLDAHDDLATPQFKENGIPPQSSTYALSDWCQPLHCL